MEGGQQAGELLGDIGPEQRQWWGGLARMILWLQKRLNLHSLSVSLESPQFRAEDLFDEPHGNVFVDLIAKAKDPAKSAIVPPRVRLHASRRQAFEFLHFLDQRLCFSHASQKCEPHTCVGFALVKGQHKDHLILDARPPNALEDALVEWTQTL